MRFDESIFKAYDIRGVYPEAINEENIAYIVKAIYSFFVTDLKKPQLQIVLGRDMRTSSPSLFEVVKNTLVEMGATVVDVDLVSTPTFYFSVLEYGYDAGIQISASHNPKEYNGIKFVKRVGNTLLKIGKSTGMDEVKRRSIEEDFVQPSAGGSVVEKKDVLKEEVDFALETTGVNEVKPLKIVADPANAMGGLYLEELLSRFPNVELIKMNFELDGTFPAHQPDPLQFDTLKELQQKVIAEKADLGVAPDGDGDRIFFINEKGEIVDPTLITSLIASEILEKNPKDRVIADIRYLRNVMSVANRYGKDNLIVSRVGHAFITELLNKENAAFAGESSSHFYYRETGGAESAIITLLYVLRAMNRVDEPISQILEQFHTYFESTEINFKVDDPQGLLEKVLEFYPDGEVNKLDGLSIDYPEWRFNLRASNTEPLVRLNLEASSEDLMTTELNKLLPKLEQLGAVRK